MEMAIGALIAFAVEVLLIALLLAPRWTLRTLARPFRALWERIRRAAAGASAQRRRRGERT